MAKRWSSVDLEKLRSYYWRGYTNREIAEKFGCKVQRIKDALSTHGITTRKQGAYRRHDRLVKLCPPKYKAPSPIPKVRTKTPEPKSRELDYMDAIEHRLCLWMDGKLKCCGRERTGSHRYCQHHYEKSLKKNEVI